MDTHSDEMSDEKKMMWRMKHREYGAIRALTAVIVLIFVFWLGFEFGEIRASIGMNHYGYRMEGVGSWTAPWADMTAQPTTVVDPGGPEIPAGTTVSGATTKAAQ